MTEHKITHATADDADALNPGLDSFDSQAHYKQFVAALAAKNQQVDGSAPRTVAEHAIAAGKAVGDETVLLATAEPWLDQRVSPTSVLYATDQHLDADLIEANDLRAAAVEALAADLRAAETLQEA